MPQYELNDNELKKSLNMVVFGTSLGMVFYTIFGFPVGAPIFTGFMRALGANDLVYSVVMAIPVIGGISQIIASYYLENTGRRRSLFIVSGFVHRLFWIPVALIPLIFSRSMHSMEIVSVTVMIMISSIAFSVSTVSYNFWMGDLVPLDIAGRFFSQKTLISTISGGIAGLAVGLFMDRVDDFNGFAIVFVIGALFGAGDVASYFWVKHPTVKHNEKGVSLLKIIVDPFKNRRYMKLVIFATIFMFGVNVTAPFFNVYMLENLKMNYFMITLSCQIMSSIATVLVVRKWGFLCDKFGYKSVVGLGGFGVVLCPIVWVFVTPSNLTMVFVANILSGITWSGYNLAIFNQSVWLAPKRNRSAYIACFTMLTSVVGTAAAYVAGGYFMQYAGPAIDALHIPFLIHYPLNSFQVLFIISAVIRLIALIVFLPMVQEKGAKSMRQLLHGIYEYVMAGIMKP